MLVVSLSPSTERLSHTKYFLPLFLRGRPVGRRPFSKRRTTVSSSKWSLPCFSDANYPLAISCRTRTGVILSSSAARFVVIRPIRFKVIYSMRRLRSTQVCLKLDSRQAIGIAGKHAPQLPKRGFLHQGNVTAVTTAGDTDLSVREGLARLRNLPEHEQACIDGSIFRTRFRHSLWHYATR